MPQTIEAPSQPSRARTRQPPLPRQEAPAREPAEAPRRRLPYIDGLRGAAMLMVLAFHGWLGTIDAPLPLSVGRWRVDVTSPLQFGYLGVHLFLLLSGFCLTYPLAREGASGMLLDLRRFFQRRAWRILPPYYASLAGFTFLRWFEYTYRVHHGMTKGLFKPVTTAQVISHIFMVHNLSPDWIGAINGPFWSLALEWQLYLVFPLLVWGFRRWGPARTLAAVLALTLTYRSLIFGTVDHTGVFLGFLANALPGRLFEFVLGMGAAVALVRLQPAPARILARHYLGGFALLSLLGVCVSSGWSQYSPITDIIWGLAFFCLVMYGGCRSVTGGSWLDARPLVGMGVISYSVYLIHAPLLRRAYVALLPLHLSSVANLLLFELVMGPLMLGCGWLFFRAVEGRFLRSGPRSPGAGAPPRFPGRTGLPGIGASMGRSS